MTPHNNVISKMLALLGGENPGTKNLPERRMNARLVYPPELRPRLRVREHALEVIDISETGLRFFGDATAGIGKRIHGTVKFTAGSELEITGEIVWQSDREVGLLFTHRPARISKKIILEEIRTVLRRQGIGEQATEGPGKGP